MEFDAVRVIVEGRGSRASARVKRISAGDGVEEERDGVAGMPKWTMCPDSVSLLER